MHRKYARKRTTIANPQYRLTPDDLQVVLALARAGTLAAAGERLGIDASTVFRALQRIERGLGQPLFERGRSGYAVNELGAQLAAHGEELETALEAARSATQVAPSQVAGSVRISTTDTLLRGLVAPALLGLRPMHPLLSFELHAGNEPASLTRRDADIAVRC